MVRSKVVSLLLALLSAVARNKMHVIEENKFNLFDNIREDKLFVMGVY